MRTKTRCACGLPLHYRTKADQDRVQAEIEELGEWMPIHIGNDRYLVQRHYIALHGLSATRGINDEDKISSLMKNGILRRGDI